jgi:uncharacterized protein (TIGR03435 family)
MSMRGVWEILIGTLLCGAFLYSQTGTPDLTFEVASIKPAAPLSEAEMASGKLHEGLKFDPARIEIRWMPLMDLIGLAYGLERSQISGPDWLIHGEGLDAHIFDIQAKLPEGAERKDVPGMVRGLLAARFHLVAHREDREDAVYALVIAESGPKLKASLADSPALGPPPNRKIGADYFRDEHHITAMRDGSVETVFVSSPDADLKIVSDRSASVIEHVEATRMTTGWLAKWLTEISPLRVIDMTELKESYQMTLDLPRHGAPKSEVSMSLISRSLAKLGLKLEKRKASVEYLVVEQMMKTPVEN